MQVKSDEFYLRAVIGSVNFKTGGDVNDFMHGWLNYQIEHHMFSDMSMLTYQRMAPEMKLLCEKYAPNPPALNPQPSTPNPDRKP